MSTDPNANALSEDLHIFALDNKELGLIEKYGSVLADRATMFSEKIYEYLARQSDMAKIIESFDQTKIEQVISCHYRSMVTSDLNESLRKELYQIGQLHSNVGLPIRWVVATFGMLAVDLEKGVNELSLSDEIERGILKNAVSKRIQNNVFWQLEGYGDAERQEGEIQRSFYMLLADANRLFTTALTQSDQTVFQQLCALIVKHLHMRCAWIGTVSSQDSWVEFQAIDGALVELIKDLKINADPEIREGQGPIGRALSTMRPCLVECPRDDDSLRGWGNLMKHYGLTGGIASIPIHLPNGIKAVIGLHQEMDDPFPSGLLEVMESLASDVSFFFERRHDLNAIERLRSYQRALSMIQLSLLEEPESERLFDSVVDCLIRETDAHTCYIMMPDGQKCALRTIAAASLLETDCELAWNTVASLYESDIPHGHYVASRVFRAGQAMTLENPVEDAYLHQIWDENPILKKSKNVGAWPIFEDGDVDPVAILVIASTEVDYFSKELCILLDQIVKNVQIGKRHLKTMQEIRRISLTDSLTGLPNRVAFKEATCASIALASVSKLRVAVGILDLDGFKECNDTLGHQAGDRLLKDVAQRLQSVMPSDNALCRLGGDEFGFQIQLDHERQLDVIGSHILEAVSSMNHRIGQVTGSLGWAVYPHDGLTYATLLANADQALYAAKEGGRNQACLYRGRVANEASRRQRVRHRFEEALRSGAIHYFLQPQYSGVSNRIEGAEMLVRWFDEGAWLSPGEFMPEVERNSHLIRMLGCHAVREAVRIRSLLDAHGQSIKVSLNIGANHFLHPEFLQDMKGSLEDCCAKGLVLEITESTALADLDRASQIILGLKEMGFAVSLDDFGTGYSSLSHAAYLPVDELKLDRKFIQRFRSDPNVFSVAGSMIMLSRLSGRHLIAEGIEEEIDLRLWASMGGQRVQGYILSPPIQENVFFEKLRDKTWGQLTFPKAYPVEDLALLGYAFLESEGFQRFIAEHAHSSFCPLSEWYLARESTYRHLSSFQSSRTIYRGAMETLPHLLTQPMAQWIEDVEPLRASVQQLCEEIGRMVQS
ncbi:EAL domain-containing protein [Ferroacidibacillus organovorans]|uniref:Diguanylate cyclase DosC n=1 Tax=Ferroacidibacillus organovorans TaxID=1765683 RepID=A0A1V4EWE5_9BACL|nr:EAL domain-containing protein [Ferroacidibacillus organovorans]OPG17239.1 hypothetical protein B2M26_02610 [Ferroacidibacillus organovorans]